MIDTVKFRLASSPMKSAFGWEFQEGTRLSETEGRFVPWMVAAHKETGLRIKAADGIAQSLEVSLPRIIYGHNGKLLRRDEINSAYFAALDLASEVTEIVMPEAITRYDLVHHFRGAAYDFIDSLRGLTHSKVRRKQVEYFDSGLTWPGKDCHIRLYDKKLEKEHRAGMIQRLEFQLRGSCLRDVWSFLGGFDPEACYKQYRDLCHGFSSRSVPQVNSVSDLLCCLKQHNIMIDGVDLVDRFIKSKSKRSQFRFKADLKSVKVEYFKANFVAFLPDSMADLTYYDYIPEPVEQAEVA